MNKLLSTVIIFFAILSVAIAKPVVIDATDNDSFQTSFYEMLSSIDDLKQQYLASAIATIGVHVMQKNTKETAHYAYTKLINGKTADEIIALAGTLSVEKSGINSKINAKTAETFNASVSNMIVSLPMGDQKSFSSALAIILYDNKVNKLSEEESMKRLDGKTALEIIALAKTIDSPFSAESEKDLDVKPLTDDEIKAKNLPQIKKEKVEQSFSTSLVPVG